jgi:heme exporter protein D
MAFEVGAFLVFGGLAVWLFQSSQTALALVVLVVWVIADICARRSILSLHMKKERQDIPEDQ